MSDPVIVCPVIVWLRRDLRLTDHPALAAASARGGPVVPVFVWDEDDGPWMPGAASRWWLHHSLKALAEDIAARGGRLILRRGPPERELPRLAAEIHAKTVLWTSRYEPMEREREARVGRALSALGLEPREMTGTLLFEPGSIRSDSLRPYQVFTPFWRAALKRPEPPPPLAAPAHLPQPVIMAESLPLETLGLLPAIPWWRGMAETWIPGEAGALNRLDTFIGNGAIGNYDAERDRPDLGGTSMLSPHLAFGEISPRLIWHRIAPHRNGAGPETFLKQLGWREFSYHLLHAHPDLPDRPLKREFEAFPWQPDERRIEAWRRGQTGYPIVDAGMRQLWHTGWMHNRVRMIVASFLIKDLLVPWQTGEEWFWDTLVDSDLAINAASWQWVAGSGADAAPFFRVFNPVLQGEKFDPHGHYVRRWVPELAGLPDAHIHRPWKNPPLVDHGAARLRALDAFAALRTNPASRTPGA